MQASETTLQDMLSGTKVFELPYFQRRYTWNARDWQELWDDLIEQYENSDVVTGQLRADQGHFLGSIVLHPAPGPVTTVARYLLVDGQQRITTFLTLIAAFRDYRSQNERSWNPQAYTDLYLTNPYNADHVQRLVPTMKDRESYTSTIQRGEPSGQIGRAYQFFLRELRRLAARGGSLDFARFENALLLRMLVVEIRTSHSDDVNHIFHTLNFAGQKLSSLDLIRNHTFMQLGNEDAERAYPVWLEMESSLGERRMERYLWTQLVRTNPKASQRNLYSAYEQRLRALKGQTDKSMRDVVNAELERLGSEFDLFASIENPMEGGDRASVGDVIPDSVHEVLKELHEWGSLVHLPLTFEILSRLRDRLATEVTAAKALRHILSYMVRRALCAIPTNNLNRVFTSLPVLLNDHEELDDQVAALLSAEQRYWPSDREVIGRAQSVPLFLAVGPDQVRFVLTRIQASFTGGSPPAAESVTVQHVLPFKMTAAWREYLQEHEDDPEDAATRVHTLGNLALVSAGSKWGSETFSEKREFLLDEAFASSEGIATASVWTTPIIERRSVELASAATRIWQGPEVASNREPRQEAPSLTQLLISLPEEQWTTVEALAEVFAVRPDTIIAQLDQVEPVLAVKVLGRDGMLPQWLDPARRARLLEELEDGGYDVGEAIYSAPEPLLAPALAELLEQSASVFGD